MHTRAKPAALRVVGGITAGTKSAEGKTRSAGVENKTEESPCDKGTG